jgi:hypothetical protein
MVQVRDLVIGGGDFAPSQMAREDNSLSGYADIINRAVDEKTKRDADAYNIKAETDLQLYGYEALNKSVTESDKPDNIANKFFESYQAKYNELVQSAPNPLAKERLSQSYESMRGSFGQRAMSAQVEETQKMREYDLTDTLDKIRDGRRKGLYDYKTSKDMSTAAISGSESFFSPSKRQLLAREAKSANALDAWNNTPEDVQFKALQMTEPTVKGDFVSAMQMVHANEGGHTSKDGASGAPAMMGINQREHKQAYAEVVNIYNTKGKDAAKTYADNFYKVNFWDKNKIEELPENVRTIVMDGIINHWSGFQKELLSAARGGASPNELIQMRRKEYERLANEPGKNGDYPWKNSAEGWSNRMDNLEAGVFGKTNTAFDDLPADEKTKAIKEAREYGKKLVGVEKIKSGNALYMDATERGKAADIHFKEWLAEKAGSGKLNDQQVLGASVDYVNEFQALPSEIKNTFTGMMDSNDINQMMLASDGIIKILDSNVAVGNDFPEDVVKQAILVQSLVTQGVAPKDIAERIKENKLMSPDEKKLYDEAYNEFAKGNSDAKYLSGKPGFWKSLIPFVNDETIEADVPMIAAFNREARAMMPVFKNVEGARKAAMSTIRRIWDVSYINKKPRWVANAPEKRYGIKSLTPEENSQWMREQIISQFHKESARTDPEDELQISITPNRKDESFYNVYITNDEGLLFPMFWKPDATEKQKELDAEVSLVDQVKNKLGIKKYAGETNIPRKDSPASLWSNELLR